MDHPLPWLKYVAASDLDDSKTTFDGMAVASPTGDKLGTVDGFIIDGSSARPYYVVVDAGGWFRSKFFLLPIGHVGLKASGPSLVADISKDRIERFPGFDRSEFEKLSDADLRRMDEQMATACCPTAVASVTIWRIEDQPHYRAPGWWDADFYRPDRVDESARSMSGATRK